MNVYKRTCENCYKEFVAKGNARHLCTACAKRPLSTKTNRVVEFGLREGWASEIEWEEVHRGDAVIVGYKKMEFVRLEPTRGGKPQPVVKGFEERATEFRLLRSRNPFAIVIPVHSGQDISLDVPFKPIL